jgi:hypothetical protein
MGLKYKFYRLRVKLRRSKQKELQLDDVQQKAHDITIQMINDKESHLLYDPINGRVGILNGDVFVELKQGKISIVNGVYHYDVPIDDRTYEHIVIKFKEKMARKFNAIENQVISKVKKSLDSIKDNISEQSQKKDDESIK